MVRAPILALALHPGCLVDRLFYEERLALLTDNNGDGWSEQRGDCDDANPAVYPGAAEVCDGIDR